MRAAMLVPLMEFSLSAGSPVLDLMALRMYSKRKAPTLEPTVPGRRRALKELENQFR